MTWESRIDQQSDPLESAQKKKKTRTHARTRRHTHTHTNNERRHHSHPRSDRSAHQFGPPQPPQSVMWQSSLRKALVNNKNISQHVAPKGRNRWPGRRPNTSMQGKERGDPGTKIQCLAHAVQYMYNNNGNKIFN